MKHKVDKSCLRLLDLREVKACRYFEGQRWVEFFIYIYVSLVSIYGEIMHSKSLSLKTDLKVGETFASAVSRSSSEVSTATNNEANQGLNIEFCEHCFSPNILYFSCFTRKQIIRISPTQSNITACEHSKRFYNWPEKTLMAIKKFWRSYFQLEGGHDLMIRVVRLVCVLNNNINTYKQPHSDIYHTSW